MNNRYKVRLSDKRIFWNTNSINHPSRTLWESTYLPTFKDIDGTPINWIDVFSLTTILDRTDYTMLELTDTVTNKVYYFLSSKITKTLANGFEMLFVLDVWLTFGMDFIDWLVQKRLPIQVNRFLNNKLLKEWFKQYKFTQKDNLLNFSTGTIKLKNDIQPQISNITFYDYQSFKNGSLLQVGKSQVLLQKGSFFNIQFGGGTDIINWDCPLFYVFENTDGNYICFFVYGNSSAGNQTTGALSGLSIIVMGNNGSNVNISGSTTQNAYISQDYINGNVKNIDYWIDKFVGVFTIPFWKYISNWVCIFDYQNQLSNRVSLFGFIINRSDFGQLAITNTSNIQIDINYKSLDTDVPLLSNVFDITSTDEPSQEDLINFQTVYYNPLYEVTAGEYEIGIWEVTKQVNVLNQELKTVTGYAINSYFVSQISNDNTRFQMCPVNGYWTIYTNGIFEFDGNQFNAVNKTPNSNNIIQNGYGTINVAIDSYKEFVAQTKPQFNTNLQVMKSNNDLQTKENATNLIFNSLNGFVSGASSGSATKALSNTLSIGKNIASTIYAQQQLDLNYTNLQKQQDAQLASAKISSTAKNLCSSNTTDDATQKYLVNRNQFYGIGSGQQISGMYYDWDTFEFANFVTTKNDIAFYHNLIVKNGIIGNMIVTADNVFVDDFKNDMLGTNTNPNTFLYVDFTCDAEFIRIFDMYMPSEYVSALATICDNSLRIWDYEMSYDNEAFRFYLAFYEQAKSLITA